MQYWLCTSLPEVCLLHKTQVSVFIIVCIYYFTLKIVPLFKHHYNVINYAKKYINKTVTLLKGKNVMHEAKKAQYLNRITKTYLF